MRLTNDAPIYLQVADLLEAQIARSAPGDPLSSENELASAYGVSRLTARAAVEELERRYLVRRSRGRRTFVGKRVPYNIGPSMPPSWSETVRRGGAEPRSETERCRKRRPPRRIADLLRLDHDCALFVARRRFVDGELAAYAETWLAADLVPDLMSVVGREGSLHRAFEETYALEPVRAVSRVEFIVAPASVAAKLEVEGRPMVFQLEGRTDSAKAGRPIQCTTSWLRADMFRIVVDLDPAL